MDNISIKFDRFFTGYSSDMKILMDILKENKTSCQIPEKSMTVHQKSVKSNHSLSAISVTTNNCLSKNLSLFSYASNEDSYDKKLLKQLKLRGIPLRNSNDIVSLNSELIIDSESDSEIIYFRRGGSVQKQKVKKILKKRGVSLNSNLLNIHKSPYSKVWYKSDSEVSLRSGESSKSKKSCEIKMSKSYKGEVRHRSKSFSGFSRNYEYVLNNSLMKILERRNTEKNRKIYPKIFISKPDEMTTGNTCKHWVYFSQTLFKDDQNQF